MTSVADLNAFRDRKRGPPVVLTGRTIFTDGTFRIASTARFFCGNCGEETSNILWANGRESCSSCEAIP